MTPTEHELTVATDAIARKLHEHAVAHVPDIARGTFDQLHPTRRLEWREAALPLVVAALEALPDRAEEIIWRVQEHCCTCHTADRKHEDWCPAYAIQDELR